MDEEYAMMTDMVGFVAEPNCGRGTIGILWQCLTTIFLCVYTTFHPKIQQARYTRLQQAVVGLMIVCILVVFPEGMLLLAVLQYLRARNTRAYFTRHTNVAISLKQAHYIVMNGVRLRYQGQDILPTDKMQYEGRACIGLKNHGYITAADYANNIPSDQDIDDLAKEDLAGKTITIVQAVWTATTIAARAVSHYQISLLELSTSAFILNALGSYMFWFSAPYGVRKYHIMTLVDSTPELVSYKAAVSTLTVDEYDITARQPSNNRDDTMELLTQNTGLPLRVEAATVVTSSQQPAATSIVYRSSPFAGDDDCFMETFDSEAMHRIVAAMCIIASAVVVASHAAAWNYEFVTATERITWRISVVGIAATATILSASICLDTWVSKRFLDLTRDRFTLPTIFIYGLARLCIIVEIFLAFRSAPAGIYAKVSWASYVGHIGG